MLLYIMFTCLMLFAALLNALFAFDFFNVFVFMFCYVLLTYSLFQILFCIMHNAFNLLVFLILCSHHFLMKGQSALLRNST